MDEVKAAAERLRQHFRSEHGHGAGPYELHYGFNTADYVNDLRILARAYLRSPPRDLFDAVCEKLENLIPATASLVDFAKEKGVFLMRQVDEQLNECRDVLARVAEWRKEVGSEG